MENQEKTAEELEREKQLAEEGKDKEGEKDEKEEKSPYELYLEELENDIKSKEEAIKKAEEEKAKAEEIARQKSGAIAEERQRRKELEEELKKKASSLSEEEINRILDQREQKREELNKINQLTSDEKEREAIRKTMELKKVSAEDAFAIVNAHIIKEQRENNDDSESFVASVMAGGISSSKGGVKNKVRAIAEEGLTEAEKKKLDL